MDTTLHNIEKGLGRQHALLRVLRDNADKRGRVNLTDAQLAKLMHSGLRTVQNAVQELKAKGTITCDYEGRIGIKRTIIIKG